MNKRELCKKRLRLIQRHLDSEFIICANLLEQSPSFIYFWHLKWLEVENYMQGRGVYGS